MLSMNLKNEAKKNWTKPELKTITAEELKELVLISACSEYDECYRGFFR
jgi:hypothetical protein